MAKIKRITLSELIEKLYSYNKENGISYGLQPKDKPLLSGVVVFKQSNFTKDYPEVSRSYRITNQDGKRLFPNMCGNSLYGDCLDGTDQGVRLDYYGWEPEYCYLEGKAK